jgi:ferric-dicitrate binding protein FerR (iron transport regulator)
MEQQYDDTFLARWLANELTAEELQEFQNSEDFEKYAQIVDTLDNAELPEFDVEVNFQATLDKLAQDSSTDSAPQKRVIPLWSYAAAASVALIFFAYSFFFSTTTYTTQLAEKTSFELPDGSQVEMNAGSEINFKKSVWSENRTLDLKGEAYFKVEKGSSFTVNTNQGNVKVLGTQFTVNARENLYHVTCFEGKVLVVTKANDSIILTQGMSFLQDKNDRKEYTIQASEPSWINNESSFNEMSIDYVMNDLERQFDITISGKEFIKPASFTGRFSHKDANLAIQTVFIAMEIPYTTDANGNVEIQKH